MRLPLNQICVYWSTTASNAYGEPGYATPVELLCRWEDRREMFIDQTGREVASTGVVYFESTVAVGGYLYLGRLANLSAGQKADPLTLVYSKHIRGVQSSPNIAANQTIYKAML